VSAGSLIQVENQGNLY